MAFTYLIGKLGEFGLNDYKYNDINWAGVLPKSKAAVVLRNRKKENGAEIRSHILHLAWLQKRFGPSVRSLWREGKPTCEP